MLHDQVVMTAACHSEDVGLNPASDSYIFYLQIFLFYAQLHCFSTVLPFGDIITTVESHCVKATHKEFQSHFIHVIDA